MTATGALAAVVDGARGNDGLRGTMDGDVIRALAGDDFVNARAGDDLSAPAPETTACRAIAVATRCSALGNDRIHTGAGTTSPGAARATTS